MQLYYIAADSQISPNFNTKGVIMISLALLCDAVIGNVQEKAMKTYNAPNSEVVLYSYSIGFAYIFLVMLLTGDLYSGIQFCAHVIIFNSNQKFLLYNVFFTVSNENLWLRVNFLTNWIFGYSSRIKFG